MAHDRTPHLRALRAVLDAARGNLAICTRGGLLGQPSCRKPAIYTLGSPNVTLCKSHGWEHKGQHGLWDHSQAKLVASIAAYDAIEEALPDLTSEELPPEEDE